MIIALKILFCRHNGLLTFIDMLRKSLELLSIYSSPFRLWLGSRLAIIVYDPEHVQVRHVSQFTYLNKHVHIIMRSKIVLTLSFLKKALVGFIIYCSETADDYDCEINSRIFYMIFPVFRLNIQYSVIVIGRYNFYTIWKFL